MTQAPNPDTGGITTYPSSRKDRAQYWIAHKLQTGGTLELGRLEPTASTSLVLVLLARLASLGIMHFCGHVLVMLVRTCADMSLFVYTCQSCHVTLQCTSACLRLSFVSNFWLSPSRILEVLSFNEGIPLWFFSVPKSEKDYP